jgi:opacity protein-like surface antigen
MKRISRILAVVGLAAASSASLSARADNVLGIYAGFGVGASTVRSDDSTYGSPGYYNDHQFAWKAIVGVRPIPFLGAEYEYIDFGRPDRHHYHDGFYDYDYYGADSHPRAQAVFGVGYLPIPVPYVDFFVKAGASRLKTTLNDFAPAACTGGGTCFQLVGSHNVIETKFAYGAGASTKLPLNFTVRAEYERISSPYGDPDAFTVSAIYRF